MIPGRLVVERQRVPNDKWLTAGGYNSKDCIENAEYLVGMGLLGLCYALTQYMNFAIIDKSVLTQMLQFRHNGAQNTPCKKCWVPEFVC